MSQIEGRVIKAVGGLYTVASEHGRYACGVRGIFRKQQFTPLVGDHAIVTVLDEDKRTGTITRFGVRRSEMIRPRVANVDQAVIVFAAANPPINPDMVDRFLLLAEERELEAIICINKTDLSDGYVTAGKMYTDAGYAVFPVSAKTGDGLAAFERALAHKVSVLAGPSGVGKSSLVNALPTSGQARQRMETGELSRKLGRGKHTTRHAELLELYEDAFVVDTPGFTSLDLAHIDKEKLAWLFREFRPYIGACRFTDCRHNNEPDCAVKAQVGAAIAAERYGRYVTIWNELGRG